MFVDSPIAFLLVTKFPFHPSEHLSFGVFLFPITHFFLSLFCVCVCFFFLFFLFSFFFFVVWFVFVWVSDLFFLEF